ncbi:MAG: beta-N-acetylhexosaminidase, partial [Cryptosporangiaceae bacterium]|nr:beta-N-acetylhexosaminidase [Cryptosporangiaceae bacterium]
MHTRAGAVALIAVAAVAATVLTGCGASTHAAKGKAKTGAKAAATPSPSRTPDQTPAARAATLVARLGEEDLVGQVLMPFAYGADATQVSPAVVAANQKYAGV